MRVVSAKKGDIAEISICRIKSIEKVNSNCYSEGALKELMEDHTEDKILQEFDSCEIYCLKKKGRIVGTVSLEGNKIDGLYVCPQYVGRGYGRKLLNFIERRIKKKGYWEAFFVFDFEF